MVNLNERFKRHLSSNIILYCIVIFFFILGVSLGAMSVNNTALNIKNDIVSYLNGFIGIISNETINNTLLLKQTIKINIYSSLFLYISGITIVGLLSIPIYIAFRGYCIGFTIAFLTQSFGNRGYILSVASILPQSIVYIPTIFIMSTIALNISFITVKSKTNRKITIRRDISNYTLEFLILLIILIFGSFVESYITPTFMKLLSAYII